MKGGRWGYILLPRYWKKRKLWVYGSGKEQVIFLLGDWRLSAYYAYDEMMMPFSSILIEYLF